MGKDKKEKKNKYVENEMQNITSVQKIQEKSNQIYQNQQNMFDKKIADLNAKYEEKLKRLKEELQLKQKVEIHEIEERKNLHINELINNHNEAFTELKQYYNQITADNLS